jgi:ABC-type uncharacterized transport system auxiliary subunit
MRLTLLGLLILVLIPLFGGCSSYLPTDFYLIRVDPVPPTSAEPLALQVDVGDVRAPVRYQNQMVFRRGPYRVGFYEHSRWAALPSEMVRRALIDALNKSGLFARVDLIGQNPRAEINLLAEIESFDQVIDGQDLRAEFSLIIEAARADTGSTVWSYRAAAEVPQKGKGELAAAMSAAVGEALGRAIEEMGKSEALRDLSRSPKPE